MSRTASLLHTTPLDAFDRVVGSSEAMAQARHSAQRLAGCPRVPILILGETGVGKEVFAQAIHAASHDDKAPFVAINCGALARDLTASEMFGYADGAFTGARRGGHEGKLAAADGGTLFLDEFGELPLALQPQLLRVLESGEYQRVGENRRRSTSFRLLAATNCDLDQAVGRGEFRRDLFYRAAVTSLVLPALRNRGNDAFELFVHFQSIVAAEYGLPIKTVAPDVAGLLNAYGWPGNVRELRNIVISATLATEGPCIRIQHLPAAIRNCHAHEQTDAKFQTPPTEDLRTIEKRAICAAMHAQNWNLSGAARALGLAKSTLHAKIKRHNIHRKDVRTNEQRPL